MSTLPLHNLYNDQAAIQVKEIAYKNPYDFTKKHRHTYFEVMFFSNGGGSQLIDFNEQPVHSDSCYIIYPKQIHLLNRGTESKGQLIQFKEEALSSSRLHSLIYERLWLGSGPVLFEGRPDLIELFKTYLDQVSRMDEEDHACRKEAKHHLLHALLYDLISKANPDLAKSQGHVDLNSYLKSIEAHFNAEHSVQFYLSELVLTEKKLGQLTKTHLGQTPLQVIHSRLLLEAKRLLVFEDRSQKEIAHELGFDSSASFSAFIKKKTGQTASELQSSVAEIHRK